MLMKRYHLLGGHKVRLLVAGEAGRVGHTARPVSCAPRITADDNFFFWSLSVIIFLVIYESYQVNNIWD